jgi:GT2 family glycosyltransferase
VSDVTCARVVVLIPAYNAAATLPETLRSLQQQGSALDDIGAVCVADDGSTDDTAAVARQTWQSRVPLLVFGDPNVGQHANVNRGVARLTRDFDWLLLLHADDVARPAWLASMLSAIGDSDASVGSISCSWDNIQADGSLVLGEDSSRSIELVPGIPYNVHNTLLMGCWWHISGCAIRLRALEDVGPFQASLDVADWDWLVRALARGWAVRYIPRSLIEYRQSAATVSSGSLQADRDIHEGLELIARHRQFLRRSEFVALHRRRAGYALRRAMRASLHGQWPRAARALSTAAWVAAHLVRYRDSPGW